MKLQITFETENKIASYDIDNIAGMCYHNNAIILRPNYEESETLDVDAPCEFLQYEDDEFGTYGVIKFENVRNFYIY